MEKIYELVFYLFLYIWGYMYFKHLYENDIDHYYLVISLI